MRRLYVMLAAFVFMMVGVNAHGEPAPAAPAASSQAAIAPAPVRDKLLADKTLLFFVPFDFSVDAQIANHNKEGRLIGDGQYVPGVVGKCLSLPADGIPAVVYNIQDNLDLKTGTLMFWFKPNWWGDDKGQYAFLWVGMKDPNKYFAFYRSFSKDNPLALYINTNAWSGGANVGTDFIKKGKWVHIATTWDATTNTFVMYTNGKELTKSGWADITQDEGFEPTSLALGRHYGNETSINACYDEFFIFKRPLTADEIKTYATETMPKE